MICIWRRSGRIARYGSFVISCPSNFTLPSVGSIKRSTLRPVVVFPQPLSPTRPSTSPSFTENDTPSTARTYPTVRDITPFLIGKYFFKFSTSSNGVGIIKHSRPVQKDPAYVLTAGPIGTNLSAAISADRQQR